MKSPRWRRSRTETGSRSTPPWTPAARPRPPPPPPTALLRTSSPLRPAVKMIFLPRKFSRRLPELPQQFYLKRNSQGSWYLNFTEEKPVRWKARGWNIQIRNQRNVWNVFCIREEKKNLTTNQSLSDPEKMAFAVWSLDLMLWKLIRKFSHVHFSDIHFMHFLLNFFCQSLSHLLLLWYFMLFIQIM